MLAERQVVVPLWWLNLGLKKKKIGSSQIHYSEDKVSTNTVTLTYPYAAIVSCTLARNPTWTSLNQISYLKGSSMDSFTLGLLPKIDFNTNTATTHQQ
jgi:hypothetical protein